MQFFNFFIIIIIVFSAVEQDGSVQSFNSMLFFFEPGEETELTFGLRMGLHTLQ